MSGGGDSSRDGNHAIKEAQMTTTQLAMELLAHGIGAEMAYAILDDLEEWEAEDLDALFEEDEE